jgi:hypothetical protein
MIVAMLLVGCTSAAVVSPPAPPVDWRAFDARRPVDAGPGAPTAKERAAAYAYVGAMSSRNLAALGPMLDVGAHFMSPAFGDARGRDGVVRAHEALFGGFDDRQLDVSRVWRTDSTQMIEWTFRGVFERPFGRMTPTHEPARFRGLTILWTSDDGAITDIHVYFDESAILVRSDAGAGSGADGVGPSADTGTMDGGDGPRFFDQAGSLTERLDLECVRASLDALEQNRERDYLSATTDDVELFPGGPEKSVRGKEALAGYVRALHKSIGQLDTTIENAWAIGDFVIVEYDMAGELVGPIGNVPADGRVIRLHVVDVVELAGARMKRIWRYDDPAELRPNR